MAKDKKKARKKANKAKAGAIRLRELAQNPMVADVVAAALVATAAALKDSNKARQLAVQAGDQLTELAKDGADRGTALWQMALEVGRRSLAELASDAVPKPRKAKPAKKSAAKKAAPAKKPAAAKKTPAVKKAAAKKTAAKKAPARKSTASKKPSAKKAPAKKPAAKKPAARKPAAKTSAR